MTSAPESPASDFLGTPDAWGEGSQRELGWRLWEKRFASRILANAQHLRKDSRLSARDLSRRLTDAGWPVSINSVNGIFGKKGRESLSVTQLIALAEALQVSPAQLLFPPDAGEVEIQPGVFVPPARAMLQFLRGVPLEQADVQGEANFDELIARATNVALKQGGLLGAIESLGLAMVGLVEVAEQLGLEVPERFVKGDENGAAADPAE